MLDQSILIKCWSLTKWISISRRGRVRIGQWPILTLSHVQILILFVRGYDSSNQINRTSLEDRAPSLTIYRLRHRQQCDVTSFNRHTRRWQCQSHRSIDSSPWVVKSLKFIAAGSGILPCPLLMLSNGGKDNRKFGGYFEAPFLAAKWRLIEKREVSKGNFLVLKTGSTFPTIFQPRRSAIVCQLRSITTRWRQYKIVIGLIITIA